MNRRYHFRCNICDELRISDAYATGCDCSHMAQLSVEIPDLQEIQLSSGHAGESSMWRYEKLIPASIEWRSKLSVGGTPLYSLGLHKGAELFLKDESRNPSGSLKDRASEVVLAVARENGISHVVTASTGNAAASLACLAASHGLSATIFVPSAAPAVKLSQIRAYGAELIRVEGDYDTAYQAAETFAKNYQAYCRNTGSNPFTREGKKTVSFEIAEQLGWVAPDWVIVPTGDGNILSAVAKGFIELKAAGLVSKLPRLVCAQALTSNTITQGYRDSMKSGQPTLEPKSSDPITKADSISVSQPKDYVAAIKSLLYFKGIATEHSDEEIIQQTLNLSRKYGVFLELSSGTAYASFEFLISEGIIQNGSKVVIVGTGSGMKNPVDIW